MFRRKGRNLTFLLLKRAPTEQPYPGIWQIVSGRRLAGESAPQTALREVREETGVDPVGLRILPYVNTFYTVEDDRVQSVPTFAAELPADAMVSISEEHSASDWVTRKKAEHLVQWPAHGVMMDLVREYVVRQRGSVHRIPHSNQ